VSKVCGSQRVLWFFIRTVTSSALGFHLSRGRDDDSSGTIAQPAPLGIATPKDRMRWVGLWFSGFGFRARKLRAQGVGS